MTSKKNGIVELPRAIIFDNEWILVENDWDRVSRLASHVYEGRPLTGKEFKKSLQVPCQSNGRESNILAEYSGGRMNGEQFWSGVLESYGVENSSENNQIMREAMRSLTTRVDDDAISVVRRLGEEGYRLFMLSNSNPEINEGNRSRDDYFDLFDKCYFSHEMGCRKPEREAYECVLDDHDFLPAEYLFIDDKGENREGAEAVGMRVLHHKIGEGRLSDKLGYLL